MCWGVAGFEVGDRRLEGERGVGRGVDGVGAVCGWVLVLAVTVAVTVAVAVAVAFSVWLLDIWMMGYVVWGVGWMARGEGLFPWFNL